MSAPWMSDRGDAADRRPDAPWLAGLALAALATGLLVWPVGEFPLNDDWSYARFVQSLLAGAPRYTGWTSLPLVAQGVWGAGFCLPAGFSFFALRLSAAVAGLLGAGGMYALGRSVGFGRPSAFFAALTLAANPIHLNLSWTFMTDVPFLAAAVWALTGYVRYFSDGRGRWLWLGAGASLAAALVRPIGAALPVAFALASGCGGRGAARRRGYGPAAIVLPAAMLFCAYAERRWGLPPFWRDQGVVLRDAFGTAAGWHRVAPRLGEVFIYLGLFSLPFELARRADSGGGWRRTGALFVLAAALALGLARSGLRLPFTGNVLHEGGLGPVRLMDVVTHAAPHAPRTAAGWWVAATALGAAGALMGVSRWREALRGARAWSPDRRRTLALFAGCAAAWTLPLVPASYIDRYVLALLPLWLLAPAPDNAGRRGGATTWAAAGLALALMAAFSVAATRDYFAWNRARWHLLEEALGPGQLAPDQIDGGFEFNGWFGGDRVRLAPPTRPRGSFIWCATRGRDWPNCCTPDGGRAWPDGRRSSGGSRCAWPSTITRNIPAATR